MIGLLKSHCQYANQVGRKSETEASDDDDDDDDARFSFHIEFMFICETRRIQLEIIRHNFNTIEL